MLWIRSRRNASNLVGERGRALEMARGRAVLLSGFFAVAFMLYAARAVDLCVIQGGAADKAGATETAHAPAAGPVRADITDRNGELLATTLRVAALYADPHLVSDPAVAARRLAKIFPELAYGETLQKLQSGKRFVWLQRDVSPHEQRAVMELGEPGLGFQFESRRVYPQGPLAAHLVGYTNVDGFGLAGIESGFDPLLGKGKTLQLTLDIRVQHALRRELQKAMRDFSAIGAFGVVMDIQSGDILAGVSLPDFDPHQAGSARSDALFNRLTLGAYEMGSVFKIFSTAAFLDSREAGMNAHFDARQPLRVGRHVINDYHAQKRIMTVPEVFMHSSNIGSAMMGQAIGTDALKAFYREAGLTQTLSFEIPEIAKPQVPSPWREINTLTASYGHGIATTPLQFTAAVASVVNEAAPVQPHLVMDAQPREASDKAPVVSAETAQRIRQLLRLVVTSGTGTKADVPGYLVGGKTGTAEKNMGGRYTKDKLLSSFVGVFPADDPQYVMFIAVDEPKGTKASFGYATGGWVAAPAASRVIASMASILGIPPRESAPDKDPAASLMQYVSTAGGD